MSSNNVLSRNRLSDHSNRNPNHEDAVEVETEAGHGTLLRFFCTRTWRRSSRDCASSPPSCWRRQRRTPAHPPSPASNTRQRRSSTSSRRCSPPPAKHILHLVQRLSTVEHALRDWEDDLDVDDGVPEAEDSVPRENEKAEDLASEWNCPLGEDHETGHGRGFRCRRVQAIDMTTLVSCSSSSLIIASRLASINSGGRKRKKSRWGRKNNQILPQRLYQSRSTSTSPAPQLFPLPPPPPITRTEALDRLLTDLEVALDRGVPFDPSLSSSLLETCTQMRSLSQGARLHRLIPAAVLRRSASLSSKLVRFYAACGQIEKAHRVFDQMPQRNKSHAFPWNSLLSGYVELGIHEDAMALYHQMEEEGVEPDEYTFPRVLKACSGIGSIRHGEAVHRHLVRSGFGHDAFVLNALVDMYSKCGDIQKARKVFDNMTSRDSVSWNSMLVGYIRHGLPHEALDICRGMVRAGSQLDSITISAMSSSFSSWKKLGLEIHGWVLRRGLEWELSTANSLVTMYSEQSRLDLARWIFAAMPKKDLVSWNAIIRAHSRDHRALTLFQQMVDSGVSPDHVTFVSLLSACANLGRVEDGKGCFSDMEHEFQLKPGLEHYGCMVNLLGRAGLLDEAYEMAMASASASKDMDVEGGATVWGALLYACSLHGEVEIAEVAARRLFELEPDNEHNFELLMSVYRDAGRLEEVERVRSLMEERGLESEL
ncbi:hypothetical protein ZIOFF_044195 [Zingiber officinale]|uniref:Pentatricopeptide repeat-containing protein n=2 Tax=Zingiber officinale TaxID=94328 RepID=A0A8J5G1S2_ZINOF|nr:hypothetical protein ZIOFF_044195 [Zingiber officinale]